MYLIRGAIETPCEAIIPLNTGKKSPFPLLPSKRNNLKTYYC
jgi:hypothetical protein